MWGSTYKTYLEVLKVKLNNILRVILSCSRFVPNSFLYSTLKILQIDDIYTFELAKLMHQLHHKKLPHQLENSFTKITQIHDHYTRNAVTRQYYLPRIHKSFSKNILSIRGPQIWSHIDDNLKLTSWSIFKKRFKAFLLSHYES